MLTRYVISLLALVTSNVYAVDIAHLYGNWYSEGNMKEFNQLTDVQKEQQINAGFKPIIAGNLSLSKGNKFELAPIGFIPVNGTFTFQNDILSLYSTVNPPITIVVKMKDKQLILNYKDGTIQKFYKK